MAQGDIFRAAVKSRLNGINCVNVFHYVLDDAPTNPTNEEQALAKAIEAELIPELAAILTQETVFHCVQVANLDLAGNPYDYWLDPEIPGDVNEDSLPANKTYVFDLYTADLTRNGRGRKYLSGIPETWEDDNAIHSDHAAAVAAVAAALKAILGEGQAYGEWSPQVYSPTPPPTWSQVLQVRGTPQVHSLRGRTAKRC